MLDTVHADDEVEVLRAEGRSILRQGRVPISFSSWSSSQNGDLFGRTLFEQHGFETYYVRSKRNHWWHCKALLPVLREIARTARAPFLYGSSMGGYGALYYSRLVNLPALALSPQAVVRPGALPQETRWLEDRSRIETLFDEAELLAGEQAAPVVCFFDLSHAQDRAHVDFIAENSGGSVRLIDEPFSGHTPIRALTSSGVLQSVLVGMSLGAELDFPRLEQACAEAYLRYSKGLADFLRRSHPNPQSDDFRLLLKRCDAAENKDFEFLYFIAEAFSRIGDASNSLRYSRESVEKLPKDYVLLKHARLEEKFNGYSRACQFLNDFRDSPYWSKLLDKYVERHNPEHSEAAQRPGA